jgi:hypothetical protein
LNIEKCNKVANVSCKTYNFIENGNMATDAQLGTGKYIYSIDLSEVKDHVRNEAYAHDRSIHFWVKKILREYFEGKGVEIKKGCRD